MKMHSVAATGDLANALKFAVWLRDQGYVKVSVIQVPGTDDWDVGGEAAKPKLVGDYVGQTPASRFKNLVDAQGCVLGDDHAEGN